VMIRADPADPADRMPLTLRFRSLHRSVGASEDPAPVAQLDRAGGFYPPGCGFDSCRGLNINKLVSDRAECP
jgi:hypothetical protein